LCEKEKEKEKHFVYYKEEEKIHCPNPFFQFPFEEVNFIWWILE
jgi:hypothetical protein